MDYTETDLPVTLKETEVLTLDDGTSIRYEESGGARDIMLNEDWTPTTTLFPSCDYVIQSKNGKNYRLVAGDYDLRVETA